MKKKEAIFNFVGPYTYSKKQTKLGHDGLIEFQTFPPVQSLACNLRDIKY